MDGIEQAIRRALAKGDADDRTFREKVYRSAFAALDRSLKEKPELTVENAIKRRKALQATIKAVETEYVPALPPEPVTAVPPVPSTVAAPELRADRRSPMSQEAPRFDFDPPTRGAQRSAKLDTPRPAKDKRRGNGRILSWVTGLVLLAVLGSGVWWAYSNFGYLLGSDMQQIEAAITEQTGQSGPPPLSADGADPNAGWTDIFRPEDIQRVTAGEGASAEAIEENGGAHLRIRSGQSSAPIIFSVGQDMLERFAGDRVVFNIVARGIDGETTQMSVECNFGAMGDCGRTRYDVGAAQEDYLFEVALADAAIGESGTIAINTDVTDEGRGVDIIAIRMRPAD